jgi:hypothetical protein
MAEEIKVEDKKDDDWMTKKWRPMMAMMYMICCLCDFAIFPVMFTIVQFWETQAANDAFRQWVPITLQGGGLFHVAMGAVLGVSAYGRTQEKLGGVATAPVPTPTLTTATPTISAPTPAVVTSTVTAGPVIASSGAAVITVNGKTAPVQPPHPEI